MDEENIVRSKTKGDNYENSDFKTTTNSLPDGSIICKHADNRINVAQIVKVKQEGNTFTLNSN